MDLKIWILIYAGIVIFSIVKNVIIKKGYRDLEKTIIIILASLFFPIAILITLIDILDNLIIKRLKK